VYSTELPHTKALDGRGLRRGKAMQNAELPEGFGRSPLYSGDMLPYTTNICGPSRTRSTYHGEYNDRLGIWYREHRRQFNRSIKHCEALLWYGLASPLKEIVAFVQVHWLWKLRRG
ncbi:hypothetical protein U1Q18_050589, partial [Sarracenia purpurea var. burkii]